MLDAENETDNKNNKWNLIVLVEITFQWSLTQHSKTTPINRKQCKIHRWLKFIYYFEITFISKKCLVIRLSNY